MDNKQHVFLYNIWVLRNVNTGNLNSLNNFLWDIFVRTFECKEALYEDCEILNDDEKSRLIESYLKNIDIWEKIYGNRVSLVKENVRILKNDKVEEIDEVFFHERFGWVVNGGGEQAYLGKLSMSDGIKIEIGRNTYFSGHSFLRGSATFRVGKYTSIAEGLYGNVIADYHPMNYASDMNFRHERRLVETGQSLPLTFNGEYEKAKEGIEIGNDVWIARNVRLYHGVRIGDGCVIAESSLVRKDCEPYGIYGGTPAKLIRYRFPQSIIKQLLKIKWWNWPFNKIKRNVKFFDTDLTSFEGNLSDILED